MRVAEVRKHANQIRRKDNIIAKINLTEPCTSRMHGLQFICLTFHALLEEVRVGFL